MEFLEPLEYPEWEIDLDAMRVEDLAVEFVRQSFANQQLVDFGAPARSHRFAAGEVQQVNATLMCCTPETLFALRRICQADFWCFREVPMPPIGDCRAKGI